jgi:DNA-binding transcriptional regulator YdaS (Cro superfamily)
MKTMQAQLDLRPVQWAQLQHLVRVNQITSANGVGASGMAASSPRATLVTPLNEAEMQKLRAVLAARDIKPNVLRLSNDNPPRLEFQANDVLFSAWIEVLDELRQVWRLYPESVSAIASATPGLVQVSSTLKQMNAQVQSLPQSVLPKAP